MNNEELLKLYDKHCDSIYKVALSYTHSVDDAWDVVQATFLKLMEKSPVLSEYTERKWLVTVAVNKCKDLLKSGWRQRNVELDESVEKHIDIMNSEEKMVFSAIMQLPLKYRLVIHLHYYEGYTFKEIAEILKISPSAVSMRLHRSRELLKELFKEEGLS